MNPSPADYRESRQGSGLELLLLWRRLTHFLIRGSLVTA